MGRPKSLYSKKIVSINLDEIVLRHLKRHCEEHSTTVSNFINHTMRTKVMDEIEFLREQTKVLNIKIQEKLFIIDRLEKDKEIGK